MKKLTSIIFKSQKIGDGWYSTFNSDNEAVVDLINTCIINKIKEFFKNPSSLEYDINHYDDLYLDGSAKTKDGTKFKFHDPDLKYSIGDESNSYFKIDIFDDDNQEIHLDFKISGEYYIKRNNIMDFIKTLNENDSGNMSAKTVIMMDPIVSSIFHLSPNYTSYNPWNPTDKQTGWHF